MTVQVAIDKRKQRLGRHDAPLCGTRLYCSFPPRGRDFLRNKKFLEKSKFWLNMAVT